MTKAPIALFVYNRPRHTQQTIEALSRNELASESDLFIFSDAPKIESARASVESVREHIRGVRGFRSISIIEREKNFGLANSIVDGVTHLCKNFGRAIILEDDLLTSPNFLLYMNYALDLYKHDLRIMQISGHMFPVELAILEDAILLPFTTSWGWATWDRAWASFDPLASGYKLLRKNRKMRHAFNFDGAYDFLKMLDMQMRGEIDSWAIKWYLSVFLKAGLALHPKKTLIKNIGMDGSGVHCGADKNPGDILKLDFKVQKFPKLVAHESDLHAIFKHIASQGNLFLRTRYRLGL